MPQATDRVRDSRWVLKMTTFFVAAFVALPLMIALVILILRSRSFFFNILVVVGLVLSFWGVYQAAIYLLAPASAISPIHVPASVGPCLGRGPTLGREIRDERCYL
jgi:hypothetical protein